MATIVEVYKVVQYNRWTKECWSHILGERLAGIQYYPGKWAAALYGPIMAYDNKETAREAANAWIGDENSIRVWKAQAQLYDGPLPDRLLELMYSSVVTIPEFWDRVRLNIVPISSDMSIAIPAGTVFCNKIMLKEIL